MVACATGSSVADPSDGDRVEIVATTSIIGDVVSSIVGDSAAVEVLLPAGADPHDFEPSPQQVASINDADLVVTNGLGLEEGLTDVIEAAAAEGTPVLRLAEGVDPPPGFGGTEQSPPATKPALLARPRPDGSRRST